MEERLAFILSCLKINPLQEHHADLFGIEQKQCYEFVHGLRAILHKVLVYADYMPAHTKLQDNGYQGYIPFSVRIIQPQKKPKGKDLTKKKVPK